jgi:hypothetical protein
LHACGTDMKTPPRRAQPGRSVADALDASATVAGLLAGHRRAHACFDAVKGRLVPLLRAQVRPGPIEDGVWTLLVTTSGAGAKLRQLLPTLLEGAREAGHEVDEIRIKVAPRQ